MQNWTVTQAAVEGAPIKKGDRAERLYERLVETSEKDLLFPRVCLQKAMTVNITSPISGARMRSVLRKRPLWSHEINAFCRADVTELAILSGGDDYEHASAAFQFRIREKQCYS